MMKPSTYKYSIEDQYIFNSVNTTSRNRISWRAAWTCMHHSPPSYPIAFKAIYQIKSARVGRPMIPTCSCNPPIYPFATKPSPSKQFRQINKLYQWSGSSPKYRIDGKAANHRTNAPIGRRIMHVCLCPPRYPFATKPFPPRVSC